MGFLSNLFGRSSGAFNNNFARSIQPIQPSIQGIQQLNNRALPGQPSFNLAQQNFNPGFQNFNSGPMGFGFPIQPQLSPMFGFPVQPGSNQGRADQAWQGFANTANPKSYESPILNPSKYQEFKANSFENAMKKMIKSFDSENYNPAEIRGIMHKALQATDLDLKLDEEEALLGLKKSNRGLHMTKPDPDGKFTLRVQNKEGKFKNYDLRINKNGEFEKAQSEAKQEPSKDPKTSKSYEEFVKNPKKFKKFDPSSIKQARSQMKQIFADPQGNLPLLRGVVAAAMDSMGADRNDILKAVAPELNNSDPAYLGELGDDNIFNLEIPNKHGGYTDSKFLIKDDGKLVKLTEA